jgi:hypothetical protein
MSVEYISSSGMYCDVCGRMPSLLGNLKLDTPIVTRQPKVKHLHGYAHHSVLSRCMVALQPSSNGYMDMLTTSVLLRACWLHSNQ